MNNTKKIDILRKSSAILTKIKYYEDNIKQISDPKALVTSELTSKITGVRSTIWVDVYRDEVLSILTNRLLEEQKELDKLLNRIKL